MSIIQIITGPPRSGKARHVIDSILPYIKENRCAEVLVLVPSNLKAEEIREFLLSREGVSGFLGLKILTFLDLTLSTFHESSLPGRVNTPLARRWMVQNLLEKLPLEHLKKVRETRGLSDLSVDFIRTLKEAGISPNEFQGKRSKKETSPKLFEMGKIFQAYEDDRKKRNLLDREDLFTLAANDLGENNNGPFSRIRKIVVTGFYDFTPLQLNLLSSLSKLKSMEKIILTLLHQEGRGPGQRFTQRTLDRIRHVFPEAEITSLNDPKRTTDNPLKHLSRHFLAEGGEVREIPCNESVKIIHTPGNYREVEEIARRIRFLVHHKTHTFREIAVIFRSINHYRDKVREVFRFYKIPHRMAAGFPLRTNPLIQAVTGILEVPRSDYQREAVCRLLRSDYFKFEFLEQSTVAAERFDTLSREAMIHGRKEEWKSRFTGRIKNLQSRVQFLEDGNVEGRDLDLREQKLEEYRQKIENYTGCAAIIEALIETLSTLPKRAPIRTFVEVLNNLMRTLDVEKEIYASMDLRLIRRDQRAVIKFQELLNLMMEVQETVEW
jgi:ATP-dependent helicase/DNAse subunit B